MSDILSPFLALQPICFAEDFVPSPDTYNIVRHGPQGPQYSMTYRAFGTERMSVQ